MRTYYYLVMIFGILGCKSSNILTKNPKSKVKEGTHNIEWSEFCFKDTSASIRLNINWLTQDSIQFRIWSERLFSKDLRLFCEYNDFGRAVRVINSYDTVKNQLLTESIIEYRVIEAGKNWNQWNIFISPSQERNIIKIKYDKAIEPKECDPPEALLTESAFSNGCD